MSYSVTLKVLRFDPSTDEAPYYQDYTAEWQDDGETDFMSLLQAMSVAYDSCATVDGDPMTFDMNCANGWCGRCTMMVDGKPSLACWTKVEKGKTYTVEPLAGFPVVRDLVVDKSAAYRKFVQADVAVQSAEPITKLGDIPYDLYWNTLSKLNTCRECMCCYAACPKVQGGLTEKFIGPGAMMQIAMRHMDPRDEADRAWQAAMSGVFECDLCGECSSVCPATIDIVGLISTLQKAASEKGLGAQSALTPASAVAMAGAIAEARAGKGIAGAGSAGSTAVSSGASVEEIVQASCGQAGCHTAESVLEYRVDADAAQLRVDSHVANKVDLDEGQKAAFVELFTE